MAYVLKRMSDQFIQWSVRRERHVFSRPTPAAAQSTERSSVARSSAAWFPGGEVQALWPTGLPLRKRSRPRAEAVFVGQCCRTAATDGLCAQRRRRRSCRVPSELPQYSRHPDTGLCDQHRATAASGGARLNGARRRQYRHGQGGRHPRQHDRILLCRWRPTVRTGRSRA
jgi:hypothetical protein